MESLKLLSRSGKFHTLVPKIFEFSDDGNVISATFKFVAAEKWMPFYVTYAPDSEDIMIIDTDGGPSMSIGDKIDFTFEGENFHFQIVKIYNEGNGFMIYSKN